MATETNPTKLLCYLNSLSPNDVIKTYRGREGCMCGCLGDYRDNNRRSAALCISAFKKALLADEGHDIGAHKGFDNETIVYFNRDGRSTVLYTTKALSV